MDDTHAQLLAISKELQGLSIGEQTEADTRADFIDRILREVLGWKTGAITRERSENGERYDYRLNATAEFAVVEAKRASVVFDLPDSTARWYRRSGTICKADPLKSALIQADGYAQTWGCGLACVTNGHQWLAFLGSRSDGRSREDGHVVVFKSLEDLAKPETFLLFQKILAESSVRSGSFRLPFLEAEGLPKPIPRTGRRLADLRGGRQKKRSALAKELEPVLRTIFAGLSSADPETLRACFVETSQSVEANNRLERITRELSEDIQPQRTVDSVGGLSGVLKDEVQTLDIEGTPSTTVLLLGQNGSGKSTFLEIFFSDRLDPSLRHKCLVLKIDLSRADPDPKSLPKFLRDRTVEELEKALFDEASPDYSDLKGIFFKEYQTSSKTLAPLKAARPDEFEIEFSRELQQLRLDTERYLSRLLLNTRKSRGKLVCIVFDNADHFDDEFQRAAFLTAQWIAGLDRVLLLLALRDTTYWRAREQSAFHAVRNTTLFLPRPRLNEVLTKRFEFAVSVLKGASGKSSTLQSMRGLKVRITNAQELLLALQRAFTKTTHVSRTISLLASGDIREALRLFEQCVFSPHLRLDDLLAAYLANGEYELRKPYFTRALILADWETFDQERSRRVVNLFCNPRAVDASPLLAIRVLQRCYDLKGTESAGKDRGFASVHDLLGYFQGFGAKREATDSAVGLLLAKGLLEPYNLGALSPSFDAKGAGMVEDVRITGAGIQHRTWMAESRQYAAAMAEDVVLYEHREQQGVRDLADARIQAIGQSKWDLLEEAERKMVRLVRTSVLAQDAGLLTIPSSEMTQLEVASALAPWA